MTPNERPTPLTDAFWKAMIESNPPMLGAPEYDFARTLERSLAERTEERDALKKAISEGTRLDYVVRSYEAMASALIAERDTALAKLAAFSSGYVDSKQHNDMAKKLAKCRESLESIEEYWNGHSNECAMQAACEHNVNRARQALEETK